MQLCLMLLQGKYLVEATQPQGSNTWVGGALSLAQWAFIQTPHEEGPKTALMFSLGQFSVTGEKTEQNKELSAVP